MCSHNEGEPKSSFSQSECWTKELNGNWLLICLVFVVAMSLNSVFCVYDVELEGYKKAQRRIGRCSRQRDFEVL